MLLRMFFFLLPIALFSDVHEKVFTSVYKEALWGRNAEGLGWSGGGANYELTVPYRAYLLKFLKEKKIRSVVDAGCGDWESTKLIDWTGIKYTGYDVVKDVIQRDINRFSSQNIKFIHANFLKTNLPNADLLICKHVCQHITNKDGHKLLKQMHKYKHCIFVNPVVAETKTSPNDDTEVSDV